MKIVITGGSGFIGRALNRRLTAAGHSVNVVSLRTVPKAEQFQGAEVVIHLAGEPVAQRWTAAARQRIYRSRVDVTRGLVDILGVHPPSLLISASAIGIYGDRGEEILTEASAPAHDFLGHVTSAWEKEAFAAEKYRIRVACPRIGVVLGSGGGALEKMLLPFRLGVGGRLASGKQWMSWIHIDDLVSLFEFIIQNPQVSGPLNAVAPFPVTNNEFTHEMGRALNRPTILPVPALALQLIFGEMSQVLLASQRVMPVAAMRAGFRFQFQRIGEALRQILLR
jgi:uncharacterized protein